MNKYLHKICFVPKFVYHYSTRDAYQFIFEHTGINENWLGIVYTSQKKFGGISEFNVFDPKKATYSTAN